MKINKQSIETATYIMEQCQDFITLTKTQPKLKDNDNKSGVGLMLEEIVKLIKTNAEKL